jgi:hypothetical protein
MQPMMGVAAPPKQPRGGLTSLLAGVLALVAAGLTIGGVFGPITTYTNKVDFGDGESPTVFATKYSWWSFTDNGSTEPVETASTPAGLLLVLAALLLVLGAVFIVVAARTRTSGPTSAGRSLITGGVGVLAGLGLLQLLDVLAQMSRYNSRKLNAGESLDFTAGLGLYLPLGALAAGLVAVVLAHVGQRVGVARVEPNTPRMGFPAPYGYQQQMPGGRPAPTGVAVPGVPLPGGVPLAERATEVEPPSASTADDTADDDAADTQVVSNATASGAPETPASAAVSPSGSPLSAALAGEPAPAAPPQPVTPPTPPSGPAIASLTSATDSPESPAAPSPATDSVATPASPAAEPAPAASEPAEPTPLTDLPAAPPAPESSSSDDQKKDA